MPQSVYEQQLFLLYVKDLPNAISDLTKPVLFVDVCG
jgi:hypothetical protein